jgi:hypothetical protein
MELYPFYLLPTTPHQFYLWLLDTTRPAVGHIVLLPIGWVRLPRPPAGVDPDYIGDWIRVRGEYCHVSGPTRTPEPLIPFEATFHLRQVQPGVTLVEPRHLLPPSPART